MVSGENDNLAGNYGRWTPKIAGSVTPGINTYSGQNGWWYKIGKLVFLTFDIIITTKDTAMTGNLEIADLPFAIGMQAGTVSGNLSFLTNIVLPTGYTGVSIYSEAAKTYLSLSAIGSNITYKLLTATELNSGAIIRGTLVYPTN